MTSHPFGPSKRPTHRPGGQARWPGSWPNETEAEGRPRRTKKTTRAGSEDEASAVDRRKQEEALRCIAHLKVSSVHKRALAMQTCGGEGVPRPGAEQISS